MHAWPAGSLGVTDLLCTRPWDLRVFGRLLWSVKAHVALLFKLTLPKTRFTAALPTNPLPCRCCDAGGQTYIHFQFAQIVTIEVRHDREAGDRGLVDDRWLPQPRAGPSHTAR